MVGETEGPLVGDDEGDILGMAVGVAVVGDCVVGWAVVGVAVVGCCVVGSAVVGSLDGDAVWPLKVGARVVDVEASVGAGCVDFDGAEVVVIGAALGLLEEGATLGLIVGMLKLGLRVGGEVTSFVVVGVPEIGRHNSTCMS